MAPTRITKPTFKERLDRLVEAAKDLGFHLISHGYREPRDRPIRLTLVLEDDGNPNKLSPVELDVVSAATNLGISRDTAEAWVMDAVLRGCQGFDAIFKAVMDRRSKTL